MTEKAMEFITEVIHFDKNFQKLFFKNPTLERVASGYSFTEGPVWKESDSCLYFTDFPNEKIYKWCPKIGARIYVNKSNRAIGLAVNQEGNIISCESSLHRLAIINNKESHNVVSNYEGKRFNSTNDVIVAKNGDMFFTDPFSKMLGVPSEQGFNGVYWLHSNGKLFIVSKDFDWPNGLCLSLDESKLYVNDTGEKRIYVLQRDDKNEFGTRKVFAQLDSRYGDGSPDGMKVDRFDNVWVTGSGGLWVLNPEGKKLAMIKCPEFVGNFCFGGKNKDEVFITASTSVYRLKLTDKIY